MGKELKDFFQEQHNEPTFRPVLQYSSAGDCIDYFFDNADFYRDRVDEFLTVFRAFSDDRITGLEIKGIGAIAKEFGVFGLEFSGKVRLSLLCMASNLLARDIVCEGPIRQQIYRDVAERSAQEQFSVPKDLLNSIFS